MGQDSNIQLGYIQGVFGIKGWIKVYSYCRPKEQILDYPVWQLRNNENEQSYNLEEGRQHVTSIIARLSNVNSRNQAEALIHSEIWVTTEELSVLPEGEFYWHELTGLNVVTLDGQSLGYVIRLMETGANDVLVVANESDAKEILIPYIRDEVIKNVDLNKKHIIVDWQPNYL